MYTHSARKLRLIACNLVLALTAVACATSSPSMARPQNVTEWAEQVNRAAPLPGRPIEIMVVATFHFAQQDTTKVDVLSVQRQREIEQVAASLASFRPDKIFLERQPYYWQRRIDSTYKLYREGRWTLPRNEIFQLGYRIAKALAHQRVYAADHAGFWLGDSVRRVATNLGQLAVLDGTAPQTLKAVHEIADDDVLLATGSISDVLRWLNDPEYLLRTQNNYFGRLARIGNDSVEVGPDLIAEWYRRNLKIYRTILDRLDYSERRIMVIIGGDHVPPLRHFFDSNVNFRTISAVPYIR